MSAKTPKRCREKWAKDVRCERDRYHKGKHRAEHPVLLAKVEWWVETHRLAEVIPHRRSPTHPEG